jgi:hypothetical protein
MAGSSASSMIRAVTSRPIRRMRSTMKPDERDHEQQLAEL